MHAIILSRGFPLQDERELLRQQDANKRTARLRGPDRFAKQRVSAACLDHMPADRGPIKPCANVNIGRRVFQHIEDTTDRKTTGLPGSNRELADSNNLSQYNDRS